MTKEVLFNLIQIKANWNIVDEDASFDPGNSSNVFRAFSNKEIRIDEGVSKFVVIPVEGDFVFKIGYDHDDEGNEINDGCDLEYIYYQYSICDSLDKYFAAIDFYDFITTPAGNKIPVYIQEKVEPLCKRGTNCDSLTKEEKIAIRSKVSTYYGGQRLNVCWVRDFIDCYGEEELDCLMQFIDENNINDLHNGNIGYKGDNPIILDYCGYESFS